MSDDNCCGVTIDGHAVCNVSDSTPNASQGGLPDRGETTGPGRKIRGAVLLGVGCVTSPCCTPLLVPLTITLLAGTPLAAFLAQYVGWVYAALTLLSLVSLFLAVRHLWPTFFAQPEKPAGSSRRISHKESRGVPAELET